MYLDVSSMQIDLIGFRHLSEGLKKNQTLLSLNISNNYMGPQLYKYLYNCLPLTKIEQLDISKSKLGDTGIKNLARLFSNANRNCVKKLNVSENKFTCIGLIKFLEELETNKVMTDLDMSMNNFYGKLINSLTKFLIENDTIKTLKMNKCELNEDAGDALKKGLERNISLENLIIKGNSLYDEGFSSICIALKNNNTLKILDVSDNRIRERGGTSFGNVLKHNKGLKEISFNSNTLTDNAAAFIVEGVMVNSTIKKIKLKMNPISYKYKNEIQNILNTHAHKDLKNLQPNLNKEIKELEKEERTKKETFRRLKKLRKELRKKEQELVDDLEEIAKKTEHEMQISDTYDERFNVVQKESAELEELQYNLTKETSEYRKGMRIRVEMKKSDENEILEEIKHVKKGIKGTLCPILQP